VLCEWEDGNKYPADIVAQREAADGGGGTEYYVHYIDFDRRLDGWVGSAKVQLFVDIPSASGGGSFGAAGAKRRRKADTPTEGRSPMAGGGHHGSYRGHGGGGGHGGHGGHGGDGEEGGEKRRSRSHMAHDEIPEVRNIQTVEFGGYEIATWYYAPYPDFSKKADDKDSVLQVRHVVCVCVCVCATCNM
jgi:hypothetical protein